MTRLANGDRIVVLALVTSCLGCAPRTPEPDRAPPDVRVLEFARLSREAFVDLGGQSPHIGKTKDELAAIFGSRADSQFAHDSWVFWDRLVPGFHSVVTVTQIDFENEVATGVCRYRRPVGCIIVEQVAPEPSETRSRSFERRSFPR